MLMRFQGDEDGDNDDDEDRMDSTDAHMNEKTTISHQLNSPNFRQAEHGDAPFHDDSNTEQNVCY